MNRHTATELGSFLLVATVTATVWAVGAVVAVAILTRGVA